MVMRNPLSTYATNITFANISPYYSVRAGPPAWTQQWVNFQTGTTVLSSSPTFTDGYFWTSVLLGTYSTPKNTLAFGTVQNPPPSGSYLCFINVVANGSPYDMYVCPRGNCQAPAKFANIPVYSQGASCPQVSAGYQYFEIYQSGTRNLVASYPFTIPNRDIVSIYALGDARDPYYYPFIYAYGGLGRLSATVGQPAAEDLNLDPKGPATVTIMA